MTVLELRCQVPRLPSAVHFGAGGGGLTWGFFCRTLSSGNGEYLTILTDNKLKKTRLSKTEAVFLCFAFLSFQCRRVNF